MEYKKKTYLIYLYFRNLCVSSLGYKNQETVMIESTQANKFSCFSISILEVGNYIR